MASRRENGFLKQSDRSGVAQDAERRAHEQRAGGAEREPVGAGLGEADAVEAGAWTETEFVLRAAA
jgi:hypothetical protein